MTLYSDVGKACDWEIGIDKTFFVFYATAPGIINLRCYLQPFHSLGDFKSQSRFIVPDMHLQALSSVHNRVD